MVAKMSSLDNNIENTQNDNSQIEISASVVLGPARKREEYTVGWICALPIELAAARAMLDERHKPMPQMANDSNAYEYGSIHGHNIVIACLPSGEYDITSATSVAKEMLCSFSIRVGLMVGIGGSVPKHGIHLRDVVISKPSGQIWWSGSGRFWEVSDRWQVHSNRLFEQSAWGSSYCTLFSTK